MSTQPITTRRHSVVIGLLAAVLAGSAYRPAVAVTVNVNSFGGSAAVTMTAIKTGTATIATNTGATVIAVEKTAAAVSALQGALAGYNATLVKANAANTDAMVRLQYALAVREQVADVRQAAEEEFGAFAASPSECEDLGRRYAEHEGRSVAAQAYGAALEAAGNHRREIQAGTRTGGASGRGSSPVVAASSRLNAVPVTDPALAAATAVPPDGTITDLAVAHAYFNSLIDPAPPPELPPDNGDAGLRSAHGALYRLRAQDLDLARELQAYLTAQTAPSIDATDTWARELASRMGVSSIPGTTQEASISDWSLMQAELRWRHESKSLPAELAGRNSKALLVELVRLQSAMAYAMSVQLELERRRAVLEMARYADEVNVRYGTVIAQGSYPLSAYYGGSTMANISTGIGAGASQIDSRTPGQPGNPGAPGLTPSLPFTPSP